MLGFMNGIKKMRGSELFSVVAIACLLAILMAGPAQAVPLYLNLNPYPDIYSSGITTNYNAGTEAFTASGWAYKLYYDGVSSENITIGSGTGTFDLDATINASGVLSIGGKLTIMGVVASLGCDPKLLTGDLTAFGFGGVSDPFEFLFDVTGGDAAVLYGGIGATGGVIMHLTNITPPDTDDYPFNANWSSSSDYSDTRPIPEPASMLLLLAGLIGLAGFRRKIKK